MQRNRRSRNAKARRRRVIGLGGGAGAFLAFGLSPLAGAPAANADVFDDILDLVVSSAASSAITAVRNASGLPGISHRSSDRSRSPISTSRRPAAFATRRGVTHPADANAHSQEVPRLGVSARGDGDR
jgi:hypothetical protein